MKIDHEDFIIGLADAAKAHAQWLVIIRFGLPTLLENQPFFAELIVREAAREAEKFNEGCVTGLHTASDHVGSILNELGLRLTPALQAPSSELSS